MSTLNTTNIKHASSSSNSIVLAADGSLSLPADTVDIATLSATGTASSSTFLRGDNSWAAAGGGKILQVQGPVVSDTVYEITSSTYSDTDLTDTITPEATSSNILVAFCLQTYCDTNNYVYMGIKVIRTIGGSDTEVLHDDRYHVHSVSAHVNIHYRRTFHLIDSPSTTSECTYKLQVARPAGTGSLVGPYLNGPTSTTYAGSGKSSITLMEIGA